QVRVGHEAEGGQGVVELLAVLAGDEREHLEPLGALQGRHHGRHLVRLRPRAEGDDDARAGGRAGRPGGHAGAPSRRTSARRASDTAAISTTVRTRVTSVRAGGVEESSMPATPKARVAVHRRITVPRFEPDLSRSMSWMWSLFARAGFAPRRSLRTVTCVMFTTGRASTRMGATTDTAAVTLRAPITLTAART